LFRASLLQIYCTRLLFADTPCPQGDEEADVRVQIQTATDSLNQPQPPEDGDSSADLDDEADLSEDDDELDGNEVVLDKDC